MSTDNGGPNPGAVPAGVTLGLYVTPPVSGSRVAAIDRVTALSADDAIEGYDITVVRGDVILSDGGRAGAEDDLADELGRLAAWTSGPVRSGLDGHRTSTRTGRAVRKLSVPELCLAVYEHGELVGVFPCTDGERTWTATDLLDSFERTGGFPPNTGLSLSTA